ncbi:hypothetical protein IAU60_004922 [Kwoniella sp. DSM 27419]
MWAVKVPGQLIPAHGNPADLAVPWAQAFMGSWPLQLEGWIIGSLRLAGVELFKREEVVAQRDRPDVEGEFDRGDAFVSGAIAVQGGYHDLCVLPASSLGASQTGDVHPEDLYLVFASHLVHTMSDKLTGGPLGTAEMSKQAGLALRGLIWFHQLYSRILVDLAVKRLTSRL